MDRSFFILAALGAGILFIHYQEAAAPTLPAQASSPQEVPAEPVVLAQLPPVPVNSALDWSPTLAPQAANPVALAKDPADLPDRSVIERLVIPDLKVDARVVVKPRKDNTWDISGLRSDIAWLEGTAHPSTSGNTVLAGHIMVRNVGKGPFRFLDRLKEGAIVLVDTGQYRYVYQVSEQLLVKETDGEVTFDTARPQLTLLTCSNWDEAVERYQRRRVVLADLVKVESLPADGSLNLDEIK